MAKQTVQELVVKFIGDTKSLDSSLTKARGAVLNVAKNIASAVGLSTGALTAFGLASVKMIGQNDDLAKSLGLTYAELVKLDLIAREGGSNINSLASALGVMQRNLVQSSSGDDSPFKRLGLDVKEIINLSPEKQFSLIAESISKIENPAQRTSIAMEIFGKSGRELNQILSEYKTKADDAQKFTEKWKLSLSQIDVEKISAAEDALGRIGLAARGTSGVIAAELSPAIETLANDILDTDFNAKMLSDTTAFLAETFIGVADVGKKAFQTIRAAMAAVYSAITSAVAGILDMLASVDEAMRGVANRIPFLKDKIADASDLRAAADAVKNHAQKSIETLKDEANTVIYSEGLYQKYLNTKKKYDAQAAKKTDKKNFYSSTTTGDGTFPFLSEEAAQKAAEGMKNIAKETDNAKRSFEDMGRGIDQSFDTFVDSIARGEDALESLKKVAFDVLKSIIDGVFQTASGGSKGGGIGSAIAQSIGNIFQSSSAGSSGASGLFGSIGKIFGFAKGGVVSGANLFPIGGNIGMMGEKGAEAIMPLTRGGDGKLGVAAHGNTGKNIVQNINISTGVQQTVRAEFLRLLPEIREISISANQDAARRGI